MASFTFRLPTREQIRTSRNGNVMLEAINSDSPRHKAILIKGCPGSGKTTVTIYRLIRLSKANKNVILFIYNEMLRIAVKNTALANGNSISNHVKSLHKWFPKQTNNFYEYFNNRSAPSASELIDLMKKNNFKSREYYEVLVDEGQDLNAKFYQSFPYFFDRISVGADEAQKIYNHGTSEHIIQDILEDYEKFDEDVKTFPLEYNYRNTYSTINFARQFVPENAMANNSKMLVETEARNKGELPNIRILKNDEQQKEELKRLIDNLSGEGVNIAILFSESNSVDKYFEIISNNFKHPCSKYYNRLSKDQKKRTELALQNILVTTFQSAKGMEFDFVILPEFNNASGNKKNHYYVACTRASNQLYILCSNELPTVLQSFDKNTYELIDDSENDTHDDLPF